MASVALVLGAGQKAVEWPPAQPLTLTSTGAPGREEGPALGSAPFFGKLKPPGGGARKGSSRSGEQWEAPPAVEGLALPPGP